MRCSSSKISVRYDKIIIGGGFYGMYAAMFSGRLGQRVLLLERESQPFCRATYINQARVHMGYHYPRSISTAVKSHKYFDKFNADFSACINSEFDQVYAVSANFSWTDGEQFKKFCSDADIPCSPVHTGQYFKKGLCDAAYLTKEYSYDAKIQRDILMEQLKTLDNVTLKFGVEILQIENTGSVFKITSAKDVYESVFVLNATYASVNQIHRMLGYEPFKIKYELCEIILCEVSNNFKNIGLTVMDGTFFSIMPFGKMGLHSLTSVSFTPHMTSYDEYPIFPCQRGARCSSVQLENCNNCPNKPKTSYPYMSALARKYIKDEFQFKYISSLFSMKPILKASEIDDSRPTVIRKMCDVPTFYSVLSGKINTVYDLEEILK
jgi:hypothetical protein